MSEGKFPTLEGYALSPTEDNMHWFLSRILIGRLLALGGVFLAVRFLQPEYIPGYALFICISLLTLIPYSIWVKRRRAILRNLSVQFLFDIFVVTGLIHFSGGVASPFFILYPLVILTSGFVVTGGLALKITILSSICYGLVLALETQGFLPYYGSDPTAYADVSKVFVTGTTRIFIFVFFAATSAYLSSFNAYQNRQIRSYASMVETVFDHIPAGIFGVLEDGTIAMANSAAGTLAGIQTDTLRGKQFSSLFVEEEETRQAQPESTLKEHLKPVESGTDPIPVLCICSKTTVPSGLFKGPQKDIMSAHNDSADTASSVMIWAVHDITAEVEAESANRKITRLQTTEAVATELAHHVRNALTAISGATHMLQIVVPEIAGISSPDQEVNECVVSMKKVVDSETERLESKIADVLSVAEQDPDRFSTEAAELFEQYISKGKNDPRES